MSERVPLIVRIAGLDAGVIEPFTTSLAERVVALQATESALETARSRLVDRLFERVPEVEPNARRLLLAVKRDAHNGRSLARHRDDPRWPELLRAATPEVEAVQTLENRQEEQKTDLREAWAEQLHCQRRHLLRFLGDRELLRGIALGSPGLVENLERLRKRPVERYRRKERGLEASLVRYLSRTALKLSPFSTLTRVAMCEAVEDGTSFVPKGIDFRSSTWRAHSLSRVKRNLLDQLSDLLVRHPPFREQLSVRLNSTIEPVAPERYRFLQPGAWELGEEGDKLVYRKPSLIQVSLRGPLVQWLLERLSDREPSYREVVSELAEAFPSHGQRDLSRLLDKFLDLGFLIWQLPWTSDDLHLELRMLEHLETMTDDRLRPVVSKLRELVRLEATYPTRREPATAVRCSRRLAEETWTAVAPLAGLAPEVQFDEPRRTYFHEDVLLTPAQEPARGVTQVSRERMRDVLHDLEPLRRLSNVCDRRWDLLLAFSAFGAERWPGRSSVGFLEFLDAARPLWQDYTRFEATARREKKPRWVVFDPFERRDVQNLGEHRRTVFEGLVECVRTEGEDRHLDLEKLGRLVRRFAPPYCTPRDVCLFLQPGDRTGDLWVLNEMFEAGRYHSRFTPVMPLTLREVFVHRYVERSRRYEGPVAGDGETGELVDILIPGGQTINLHAPQTPRTLVVPGQPSSQPPHQTLNLRDLTVQLRGAGTPPWLSDASGRRLVPIYTGTTILLYMPLLLKFLTTFGVTRISRPPLPPSPRDPEAEVTTHGRLYAGRVVLQRRSWRFSPSNLLQRLDGLSDFETFEALQRWRLAHGIPEKVFLARRHGKSVMEGDYKPQYIDFGSPLFASLFPSHLDETLREAKLEEVLPTADDLPRDAEGRPWSVELQVDSLVV